MILIYHLICGLFALRHLLVRRRAASLERRHEAAALDYLCASSRLRERLRLCGDEDARTIARAELGVELAALARGRDAVFARQERWQACGERLAGLRGRLRSLRACGAFQLLGWLSCAAECWLAANYGAPAWAAAREWAEAALKTWA